MHGVVRNELDALPARQEAQHLGEQRRNGPRHDQRLIFANLPYDLDLLCLGVACQVLSDAPHGTPCKIRVDLSGPDADDVVAAQLVHLPTAVSATSEVIAIIPQKLLGEVDSDLTVN